jgi:hypothetical protein
MKEACPVDAKRVSGGGQWLRNLQGKKVSALSNGVPI